MVINMANSGSVLLATLQRSTEFTNPLEPYLASAWNYMTDTYEPFTIAMWFSVILHEVLYIYVPKACM